MWYLTHQNTTKVNLNMGTHIVRDIKCEMHMMYGLIIECFHKNVYSYEETIKIKDLFTFSSAG